MPKTRKYFESGLRIRGEERETLRKQGLYIYDRREWGKDSTIEPSVAVDYLCTIVTNFRIDFKKKGPSAYVIDQGDEYLKTHNAHQVYSIDELLKKSERRQKNA